MILKLIGAIKHTINTTNLNISIEKNKLSIEYLFLDFKETKKIIEVISKQELDQVLLKNNIVFQDSCVEITNTNSNQFQIKYKAILTDNLVV